jgi:hypothetical protein
MILRFVHSQMLMGSPWEKFLALGCTQIVPLFFRERVSWTVDHMQMW